LIGGSRGAEGRTLSPALACQFTPLLADRRPPSGTCRSVQGEQAHRRRGTSRSPGDEAEIAGAIPGQLSRRGGTTMAIRPVVPASSSIVEPIRQKHTGAGHREWSAPFSHYFRGKALDAWTRRTARGGGENGHGAFVGMSSGPLVGMIGRSSSNSLKSLDRVRESNPHHQLRRLVTKPMKSMAVSTFRRAKTRLLSRKFKLGQPIAYEVTSLTPLQRALRGRREVLPARPRLPRQVVLRLPSARAL
jgi:hypothetical protein